MDLKFALACCFLSIVFCDDAVSKRKENEVQSKVGEKSRHDVNETAQEVLRSVIPFYKPPSSYIFQPSHQSQTESEYCRSTEVILRVLDFVLTLFLSDQGKPSQLQGLQNVLVFLRKYVDSLPRNFKNNDLISNYDNFQNLINDRIANNNYDGGSDLQPTWRPNDDKANILFNHNFPGIVQDDCKEALYQVIQAAKNAYFQLANNPQCTQKDGNLARPQNRPKHYDNLIYNSIPNRPLNNQRPDYQFLLNPRNDLDISNQMTSLQTNVLNQSDSNTGSLQYNIFQKNNSPFDTKHTENVIHASDNPDFGQQPNGLMGYLKGNYYNPTKISYINAEPTLPNDPFQKKNNPQDRQYPVKVVFGIANPTLYNQPKINGASIELIDYLKRNGYNPNDNNNILNVLQNYKPQKNKLDSNLLENDGNSNSRDFNSMVRIDNISTARNQQDIQPFVNNGNGASVSHIESIFEPNYKPLFLNVNQPQNELPVNHTSKTDPDKDKLPDLMPEQNFNDQGNLILESSITPAEDSQLQPYQNLLADLVLSPAGPASIDMHEHHPNSPPQTQSELTFNSSYHSPNSKILNGPHKIAQTSSSDVDLNLLPIYPPNSLHQNPSTYDDKLNQPNEFAQNNNYNADLNLLKESDAQTGSYQNQKDSLNLYQQRPKSPPLTQSGLSKTPQYQSSNQFVKNKNPDADTILSHNLHSFDLNPPHQNTQYPTQSSVPSNSQYQGSSSFLLDQPNEIPQNIRVPHQFNNGPTNLDTARDLSYYQQPPSQSNGDNVINYDLLPTVNNPNKLKLVGDQGVIELTYLVKRPNPLQFQPFYYVKYRLPYNKFMRTIKKIGTSTGLRSNGLREHLIKKSKVAELSPDLKDYTQKNLSRLILRSGQLINANFIDENQNVIKLASLDNSSFNRTISDKNKKLISKLTANVDPKQILEMNENGNINVPKARSNSKQKVELETSAEEHGHPQTLQAMEDPGPYYHSSNPWNDPSQRHILPRFNSEYNMNSHKNELLPLEIEYMNTEQQDSASQDNARLKVIPMKGIEQVQSSNENKGLSSQYSFAPDSSIVGANSGFEPAVLTGQNSNHSGWYQPFV